MQDKHAVDPLQTVDEITLFMADTCLIKEQLMGKAPIKKATEEDLKHPYAIGAPLVKPELVKELSTQMYRFHKWYMDQSTHGRVMSSTATVIMIDAIATM